MPDQDEPTTPATPEPPEPAADNWRERIRAGAGLWADAPPIVAVPPKFDAAQWEDIAVLRETFLLWITRPEFNAAFRATADALFQIVLEASGSALLPHLPGELARHELAAVAADLRHAQGFLGMVAEEHQNEEEMLRLVRLAAQLGRRVGKIADAIEGALG